MPALGRILAVQHAEVRKGFYDVMLDWAREHFPALHALFDVRVLPVQPHWWGVRALVPWLQDPVQQWSLPTYAEAMRLQAACDLRRIQVVNRVERLVHAGKIDGAARIAAAGFRVPRMVRVLSREEFCRDAGGLTFPIFIREDWGHGYTMVRADTPEALHNVPIEEFSRPVGTELVDVRENDGLCYKYRYLACGDVGISHHVQASHDWITRGENRVIDESTRQRELDYISRPDPYHGRFQVARRKLGLDFAAFDYGIGRDGSPVVWEVNPFPHIQFARSSTAYRNAAIERSVAAMLAMYLRAAGFPVPAALQARFAY